jgi:hypothetical protein
MIGARMPWWDLLDGGEPFADGPRMIAPGPLCSRAPRILDRPGACSFLARFADDGYRCPGHPAWRPRRTSEACAGGMIDMLRERNHAAYVRYFLCARAA